VLSTLRDDAVLQKDTASKSAGEKYLLFTTI